MNNSKKGFFLLKNYCPEVTISRLFKKNTYIITIFVKIELIMKILDITKPVRLKNPQAGEENLIFQVTNFNEVTNRCYIEPISPLAGIGSSTIKPQELVSVTEIENAE